MEWANLYALSAHKSMGLSVHCGLGCPEPQRFSLVVRRSRRHTGPSTTFVTTFSTLACEVLGAEISVVDRILNHVATATTSKIMRVYNKSELFEPRKRVLRRWAELIEGLATTPQ